MHSGPNAPPAFSATGPTQSNRGGCDGPAVLLLLVRIHLPQPLLELCSVSELRKGSTMTHLDFIPRTQRERSLLANLIRSEFGFSPDTQRRIEGVMRFRAWLEKRENGR